MERETKEIKVKGLHDAEHTVVIKSYLTGREANEAKAILFQGIAVEAGDKPKMPLDRMPLYESKVIEMLLVSFDGNTEKPLELLENLPSEVYDRAVAEIKEASGAFLSQPTSSTPGA